MYSVKALRDTVLHVIGGTNGQSPILVEKGAIIALNLYLLNHDKYIWGDHSNEFKPEHWVNKYSMSEFVPCFTGPRICPAQ